jgi:hypothetical protein
MSLFTCYIANALDNKQELTEEIAKLHGVKSALFPLDSIFCKVPVAKRICHFAKN